MGSLLSCSKIFLNGVKNEVYSKTQGRNIETDGCLNKKLRKIIRHCRFMYCCLPKEFAGVYEGKKVQKEILCQQTMIFKVLYWAET